MGQLLKGKGNMLEITIKPAASEALERMKAYPYHVPFVQVIQLSVLGRAPADRMLPCSHKRNSVFWQLP